MLPGDSSRREESRRESSEGGNAPQLIVQFWTNIDFDTIEAHKPSQGSAMSIQFLIEPALVLGLIGIVAYLIRRGRPSHEAAYRQPVAMPEQPEIEEVYTATTVDGRPSITGDWTEPTNRW